MCQRKCGAVEMLAMRYWIKLGHRSNYSLNNKLSISFVLNKKFYCKNTLLNSLP